ncbi:ferredoxin [Paraburkholderia sp. GAS448]|jgi:ferredoxin|uniref:ferredoxin n=1 Tax=Paraburkholderia sp. GAS448 TaxID=3035136 RepID=UPI003D194622
MKVFLDATKCAGYGTCAEICPSRFQLDEFGYASVIGNGEVAEGEQEKVLEAARRCPEKAITTA